ncbi:hypothetical protein RhiirA4_484439 [Rhizophagus irregularis]|uniref:Uncharacterized protein n=1 Tax=Rhizophagus irregularis TaxID=588596 RepID=A0A2I1HNZ6_9GLOM|nr:hypothetical protein RhiirA4_484439 [Rhizophagus irregularis]
MQLNFKLSKKELERVKNKLNEKDNIEINIYNEEDVIIEEWHVTYEIIIREINKKECKIRGVEEINNEAEESNDDTYSNKGEIDTDEDIGGDDDSNCKEDVANNEDDISSEEYRSETDEEEIEKEVIMRRSKAFYELLKDLSVPTVGELLESEENDEEMTLEKWFTKAIKAGQEATKCWYDVGKAVRNKVEEERNRLGIKEKSIKTKMYNELTKRLKGFSRKAIQSKIERAEKVYKLFKGIGGRNKINRMKNTSINTIINLKERKGEVDELIKKVNEMEEKRNSIMEEQEVNI